MNNYTYEHKRTERLNLRFSGKEMELIRKLQEKRQSTKRWEKESMSDAIIAAVRFALGEGIES